MLQKPNLVGVNKGLSDFTKVLFHNRFRIKDHRYSLLLRYTRTPEEGKEYVNAVISLLNHCLPELSLSKKAGYVRKIKSGTYQVDIGIGVENFRNINQQHPSFLVVE